MRCLSRPLRFVGAVALIVSFAAPVSAADPAFLSDVAPVLVSRCVSCHGGVKARGAYKLDTFDNLLNPGSSDAKPVVPGKPEESALYQRLIAPDPKERMPPGDDSLSADEIAAVKRWIAAGGTFDGADRAVALKGILPPRKHPTPPEKYPAAAPVFALAVSPDGKELAASGVNEVTVWDAANGKLLRRLPRLPARIHALAYTADGKHLLVGGGTAGEYGEVALVDAKTGARVRVFGTFDDIVLAVAFSADGKLVAAGSADRTARGFHFADGKEAWRASLHSDWITGVAFSPDGKWVATSSKDRTVKVLEAGTGKLFTTFNGHRRQYAPHVGQLEVYAVAFDSAGTALSVGGGAAIRAWEPIKTQDENGSAADMEERFKKAGHTRYLEFPAGKPVFALALGDGHTFSAGGDGLLREHDIASGKLVREYPKHNDWIFAVATHSGAGRVATGGFDGTVRVWDTKTGNAITSFVAAPGFAK
ncbi:PQQ-binding-like beta-propeller repeat protein [Gemmata sp. G18]|uniref:PQQ-binding-like beta-propeller repeat protein n=1 Tax=Gemmata palustris TaxID=2822762 RepID=A0ABS5BWN3_9BACT|nr:c-type cytochrome domain-containing protein [Gemmata palustris]MBP3958083.1 PQQ-binding-like beta-propeller repeat protein [Gemmata palustris]